MKRLSKHKFVIAHLPKNQVITWGGRHSAIYHFYGYTHEICKDPNCTDCPYLHKILQELIEVDDGFRREWQKRSARYARVPQRHYQRAEYRRKRGKVF